MERPAETLTHGQVTLRRWQAGDTPVVLRLVTESLDHLRPWMLWAAGGYSAADAADFTAGCQEQWEAGTDFNYAITVDGRPVGGCGLMTRLGPGVLEIGYWVHREHTGRGLATDASAALCAGAFALPAIDRVVIRHDAANAASGAVPRKLGFTEISRTAAQEDGRTPGESGIDVMWQLSR
ncbi:MAG TPA: GNAT family N-acetyltransferase [Streptosporangiaceae bacterium]